MPEKKVSLIGLGAMGRPMALNWLKNGFELTVCDINQAVVEELVKAGAKAAAGPAQAARAGDPVITMLPADPQVKAVAYGPDGLLENMSPGQTLIDMTSLSPHTSIELGRQAQAKGLKFMDAPVSGGTVGAENGSLTIMVGGDKEVLEANRHVFEAVGQRIFHIGPIGMGETVKMVNQILVGINVIGMAEAFVLGVKLGADPKTLYEVIRVSAGGSFMLDNRMPSFILKGDFKQPGFAVDLLKKDVGLAVDSAKVENLPLPLTAQVFQCLTMASASGRGALDQTSFIEILEDLAGVKVRAEMDD